MFLNMGNYDKAQKYKHFCFHHCAWGLRLQFAGGDSWARSYIRAPLLATELSTPVANVTEHCVHQLGCHCNQWEGKSTRKQSAVSTLPSFLDYAFLFKYSVNKGLISIHHWPEPRMTTKITGARLVQQRWEVSLVCQGVHIYCRLYMEGRVNNERTRIYKPAMVVEKLWKLIGQKSWVNFYNYRIPLTYFL